MKYNNKLKSIILIAIISLGATQNAFAVENKFDGTFFSLNDIIYYDAFDDECIPVSSGGGGTELVGSDNAEKVWNFFKDKGLTDNQIAGIMGGLYGESTGFVADLNEYGSGAGYGIAQWTGGRRTNLENYAKENNRPVSDLGLQLDFLWHELNTSYKSDLDIIKGTDDISTVVKQWVGDYGWGFERPSADHVAKRNSDGQKWAKDFVALYGGKGGNSSSSSSNDSSSGKYTFIGDSITEGVKDKLSSQYNGSEINSYVGRGISQGGQGGGSIMDYLNSNPKLENNIVINIGTNDQFPEGNARQMLDKIGKDKTVYLVNNYSKNGATDFDVTNSNIANIAKDYSNVKILDWKGYVDKNGGREKFYAEDGIHLNDAGKELYMKFLEEELSGSGSSSDDLTCKGASGNFGSSEEATSKTEDGFSMFLQTDPRWANEVYAPEFGHTMGIAACGPTSFAMIATALGVKLSPLEAAKKAVELGQVVGGGALNSQAGALAKEYNLQSESISNIKDIEEINRHLDKGHLIWMGGQGVEPPFTTNGHIVAIRGRSKSGKWLISNPFDYPGRNIDKAKLSPMYEWNPSDVVKFNNTATAIWR